MSLTTPESVQKLQAALHDKAKKSPDFRFYALYDKVYRKDVLTFAYACCKANGGAAGVDGQTFEDIEAYGAERWLDELTQELKSRTYQPLPCGGFTYRSLGDNSARWEYPLSVTAWS
jgi:RNA-directed DNA polymerase